MFLDTSGLFCLLDREDPQQAKAARLYAAAQRCLTQSYVLAELVALGHARGVPRTTVLGFLNDLAKSPRVTVIWVNQDIHQQGMELLGNRLDKGYSLCDAVSFVLMREHQITEALTTDRHFVQEGFVRLLDP
jgi:predicted nucleic acid-binding protein